MWTTYRPTVDYYFGCFGATSHVAARASLLLREVRYIYAGTGPKPLSRWSRGRSSTYIHTVHSKFVVVLIYNTIVLLQAAEIDLQIQ